MYRCLECANFEKRSVRKGGKLVRSSVNRLVDWPAFAGIFSVPFAWAFLKVVAVMNRENDKSVFTIHVWM